MCAFVMSFGVFCMMKARLLYGENGMKTRRNMSFCGILRQKKYAHFHLQVCICRCVRMLRLHAICAVFMGRCFCINKKGVLWASAKIKKQVIWLMGWQIV